MKTIRLEKLGTTGKPVFWQAEVNGAKVTYSFGRVGGAVQSETVTYTEGKNAGRANATTPEQQCLFEAEVKARKKLDKEYQLVTGTFETKAGGEAITTSFDVPLPMLAKTYEDQRKKVIASVYLQPKLDGNRCLVNTKTGKMYSRTRKEITHLPFIGEAVKQAVKGLDVEWVDGELFTIGLSFNEVQTIIRREKNVEQSTIAKMRYHIFDVLLPVGWEVRRDVVAKIKENPIVKTVKDVKVNADQLDYYHDKFVTEGGYEGAIIRLPGVPYENKRSSSLIKYKKFQDEEFQVVGWKCEKHDDKLMGAAHLIMKDGQTFDARPAMSNEEKAEIWANKEKYIGRMATVKFQEKDAKSGIPRFPVLIKFRCESDTEEK